jgi:MerR family mercuric resistance operon transcriptional regulator
MPPITASRADRLDGIPIGELSRLTGVNIETIRCYEKIKMLRAPPLVPKAAVAPMDQPRLACSPSSGAAGSLVSVSKTSAPCSLWPSPGKASCADAREIAAHHLDEIRSKIADLRKLERLLAKTIAQCSGTRVPDCPILDILDVRRS